MPENRPGLKDRVSGAWAQLKSRQPWLDHVVRAYAHYKDRNGDYLAAAITYFSFLALFPVILLSVSVAGFVLASDHSLLVRLTSTIGRNAPGDFGSKLQDAINTAVNNRAGVGVVGLVGVALAGLGWIENLRTAIDTVWGIAARTRNFIIKKLADAGVLAGLGLGVVVSLGLTVGGTAATGTLLRLVNLDGVSGVGALTRVVGILLAVAGDMVVFGWLIVRIPDVAVSRRLALKTALLAAVGFEVLKVVGTYYIARVSKSPTAGIFGSIVGVLVWIDLVSRYLLYCVAWAASGLRPVGDAAPAEGLDGVNDAGAGAAVAAPAAGSIDAATTRSRAPAYGIASPLGLVAGLFGAGAAVGAAVHATLLRRRTAAEE